MNPKNVLYFSHFPDLNMGGQKSMTALIENLDRERYKPFCVCPAEGQLSQKLRQIDVPVRILPLTSLKPKNFFRILKNRNSLKNIIDQDKISILHPDHERDAWLCGKSKSNAKLIWHVRLTLSKKIDSRIYCRADGIIGISDAAKKRFPDNEETNRKFRTIFNGVDTREFKPPENRTDVKASVGIPPQRFLVLFAGQLFEGKGVFDLLQAAEILTKKLKISEMPYIVFAGKARSGEIKSRIKEFIASAGLNPHVLLAGHQENIREWMQAADCLVLPSHEGTEGMGRVVFEAMACGCPPIGTDISGINEAITESSGLLIPQRNRRRLAEAILNLRLNKHLWQQLSTGGRNRAEEHFDIRKHAQNVMDFYDEVLTGFQA